MAYGFNQSFGIGSYDPNGFQGRASGTYIQPTYVNPETGRIQNTPFVPGATQPSTSTPTYQGMPPSGMDFFSQLAGLVGGGMGPAPVQAPPTAWFAGGRYDVPANTDPQMLRAKLAFYGGPVDRLPGGIPVRQDNLVLQQKNQPMQSGGQGPVGGAVSNVQRPAPLGRSASDVPSQQFGRPAMKSQPSNAYGAQQSQYRAPVSRSSFGYGRSF